jgi:hypothetical protein
MAVHPGLVRTNLWTHLSAAALVPYVPWLVRALNVPPLTGALNQIWAGQLPPDEALAHAGGYVCPYQVWATIRPDLTPENVDKLWEWCDEQAERAK